MKTKTDWDIKAERPSSNELNINGLIDPLYAERGRKDIAYYEVLGGGSGAKFVWLGS